MEKRILSKTNKFRVVYGDMEKHFTPSDVRNTVRETLRYESPTSRRQSSICKFILFLTDPMAQNLSTYIFLPV
jgi:hypothetical protein